MLVSVMTASLKLDARRMAVPHKRPHQHVGYLERPEIALRQHVGSYGICARCSQARLQPQEMSRLLAVGAYKECQPEEHLIPIKNAPILMQFWFLIFLAGFWDHGQTWSVFRVFLPPCPVRRFPQD